MIDLGRLDRRVSFERRSNEEDGLGEARPGGRAVVATVMAARAPVRDAERVAGAGVGREVTDRFTTHWSAGLAALDLTEQLVCEDVVYDLVGRKELGRREGLEWSAVARPGLQEPDA